jgi:phage terminase large subunit
MNEWIEEAQIIAEARRQLKEELFLALTAQLTAHSQYVSSGRTHYYKHWFTLDAGTITL